MRRAILALAVLAALVGSFAWYVVVPATSRLLRGTEANAPDPQGTKLILFVVIALAVVAGFVIIATLAFVRRGRVPLAVFAAFATAAVVVMWGRLDELLAATPSGDAAAWPTSAQAAVAITLARQLLRALLIVVLLVAAWRSDHATYLAMLATIAIVGLPIAGAAGALGLGVDEPETPKRAEVELTVDIVGRSPTPGADVSVVFLVPTIADDGIVTGHDEVRRAAKLVQIQVGCEVSCNATVSFERGSEDAAIAAVLAEHLDAGLGPRVSTASPPARIFLIGPEAGASPPPE